MTIQVLVADDQAPFRRAARSVLRNLAEFQLIGEARSGEEALGLVDALHPDLVLMDITMPGMGGIEAARSIAARHPQTTTILLSTYREQDVPLAAQACGAVGYVHKSEFGPEKLRELWQQRSFTRLERDR